MRKSANPAGNPRSSVMPAEPGPENLIPYEPPPPPDHLGEFGLDVWESVWSVGEAVYNTKTDYFIIERYASLQERRHQLMAAIEGQGYLVVGSQGQDVLNPLVRVVQDVESKLVALEDRLGLSPEARVRLGIAAAEHQSKLDQFLNRD